MTPRRVVEPLDVIEHVGTGLLSGPVHLRGRANDILKATSVFSAQAELDRRLKG